MGEIEGADVGHGGSGRRSEKFIKRKNCRVQTSTSTCLEGSALRGKYCYVPFHPTRITDGTPMELRRFIEIDQILFLYIV
jgi:hypothetical protein